MPKTLEQEVAELRETVKLLYSVVIEKKPHIPGIEEFERACEAAFYGDTKPLFEYHKRGGIVPDVPEPARRRGGRRDANNPAGCINPVPRKRVERPQAEPTNGCGTPVMPLPGRDKAAKEQRRVV
jgi:hypothetical protein